MDLYGYKRKKIVEIQLVLKEKDGMDLLVLKLLVLLIHTLMELNVFAQQKINVNLGKYLMEKNAFMLKVNVLSILNGMVLIVIQFLEIVLLAFMVQVKNAIQSLRNVHHQPFGKIIDVNQMDQIVQRELISEVVIVYHMFNAKMDKLGIKIS